MKDQNKGNSLNTIWPCSQGHAYQMVGNKIEPISKEPSALILVCLRCGIVRLVPIPKEPEKYEPQS